MIMSRRVKATIAGYNSANNQPQTFFHVVKEKAKSIDGFYAFEGLAYNSTIPIPPLKSATKDNACALICLSQPNSQKTLKYMGRG